MPFGADDIMGVVALSLTCLNGCVKGLTILSKARHFNRDISGISLQIELEQHYLLTWADAAGLSNEPPNLYIDLNDAAFVPKILDQLHNLLTDLQKLKERYGIDLKFVPGNINPSEDDGSSSCRLGPKLQESAKRAKTFCHGSSPWKKLAWVTVDDNKIKALVNDIRHYVSSLEKLLERSKRAKCYENIDCFLRDAVVHIDDHQKLEIVQHECEQVTPSAATAAAVRLKKTRLKLGLLADSSIMSPTNVQVLEKSLKDKTKSHRLSSETLKHKRRLSMRLLNLSRIEQAQNVRTLTYYDNHAVLLEWKSGGSLDMNTIEKRVDRVADFLHKLEPSFHSLSCQGYVKDFNLNRFGYIFNLPQSLTSKLASIHLPGNQALPPLPKLQTLRDLFNGKLIAPSLNSRLSISLRLLETLLNLHTSGWLHKEFRSENIIFIHSGGYGTASNNDISDVPMYIAGYVYARENAPEEMTEPLESELEADLYRHPLSLGRSRLPFCKSFDIFSVGCSLLEIGLWTSLRELLQQHSSSLVERRSPQDLSLFPYPKKSDTFSSTSTGATLVADADVELPIIDHGDRGKHKGIPVSLDFMKLRHELLLSHPGVQKYPRAKENMDTRGDPEASDPRGIFQSLEAATGTKYAGVVKELFSKTIASDNGEEQVMKEDERVLDLEIKARNTVRNILNAI